MADFESIQVGDRAEIKHLITDADINAFVNLTGDDNKLHHDKAYASRTSFKKPVAHGMLSAAFISTIIGTKIPGDGALWFSQNIEFLLPVRVGDEITVVAEVKKKIESSQVIELSTDIFNQNRQKVITGNAKVKVVPFETPKEVETPVIQKAALIVGATGGIGRAVAKKLASNGFGLILHYFSNDTAAKALEEELSQYGMPVKAIRADLRHAAEAAALVEKSLRVFDSIPVLINAATGPLPNIKVEELKWSDFSAQLEMNIKSNLELIQLMLPSMKEKKYGKIIHILTQAIEQPNTEWLHYITAKSALSGFGKAMAMELAKYGIRVNMVSPGMTETELIAGIPEKTRMLYAAKNPLKKLATPEDVANAIYYLATPDSDYLTGETIRVNGGMVTI
jgi:3-oxoacyl-[acyl-carrier protein] reductase